MADGGSSCGAGPAKDSFGRGPPSLLTAATHGPTAPHAATPVRARRRPGTCSYAPVCGSMRDLRAFAAHGSAGVRVEALRGAAFRAATVRGGTFRGGGTLAVTVACLSFAVSSVVEGAVR